MSKEARLKYMVDNHMIAGYNDMGVLVDATVKPTVPPPVNISGVYQPIQQPDIKDSLSPQNDAPSVPANKPLLSSFFEGNNTPLLLLAAAGIVFLVINSQ